MKELTALRERDPSTAALVLLPEDYCQAEKVKLFLHAYCQKGEDFRYGKLFKRPGSEDWLHLNQVVHEFWFDPSLNTGAQLTESQRDLLEKLLKRNEDVIGDTRDRVDPRK